MTTRFSIGIALRQIAIAHLKAILFVMFVLLIVALSLDLSDTMQDIRAAADVSESSVFTTLLTYASYRAVDIVARLLPMACLTGAFIAEILRHRRMEDIVLAAAGASPALTLAALLGVGTLLGAVQVSLEGWLRPAAVFAQVNAGLGSYAERFAPGDTGATWFMDKDRAMRAHVVRGPNPELHTVHLFEGVGQDQLNRVIVAQKAMPTKTPLSWAFINGVEWRKGTTSVLIPFPFKTLTISFPLSAAQVQYFDIGGFYIPNTGLAEITTDSALTTSADAKTALYRRGAALFLPIAFVLLGASLAQSGHTGRLFATARLLVLGVSGYVTLVLVKIFWSLGEFGEISPLTANAVPLGLAFGIVALLQLHNAGVLQTRRQRS